MQSGDHQHAIGGPSACNRPPSWPRSFWRFSARVSPCCLMEKNMGPSSASHSGSTDVTHCMNLIKGIGASFGGTQTHSTAIRRQSGGNQEAIRRHSAALMMTNKGRSSSSSAYSLEVITSSW